MTLLHIHTQMLEHFDWDEESVDEALRRTSEIAEELLASNQQVNAYELKKLLRQEYSEDVCNNLILFYEYAARMQEELEKDSEEDNG